MQKAGISSLGIYLHCLLRTHIEPQVWQGYSFLKYSDDENRHVDFCEPTYFSTWNVGFHEILQIQIPC